MAAAKGHPKAGGRQKGTPNKSVSELRQIFGILILDNQDNIQAWLTKLAARNPGKAIELLVKMAELLVPKPVAEGEKSPELDWYAEQAKKMMAKVG